MNKSKLVALLTLALAVAAIRAEAQTNDRGSVEIGAGLGYQVTLWSAPLNTGPEIRVSVPVSRDTDVETFVDSMDLLGASEIRPRFVSYGVQAKRRLGKDRAKAFQPFVTFGGLGVFYHAGDYTALTPPVLGLVGGGVERRVTNRVSVRVDAQALINAFIPAAVGRVTTSASFALGHASR